MKIITKQIEHLLNTVPSLRDNDKRLCTHIWYRQIEDKGIDPYQLSTTKFLHLYAAGKVCSDATIQRLRAKIQETNPALRGQKYLERQIKMQAKVKKDLGYGNCK